MDNFDFKKYLAEGRLLKEEKTYDIYGDGDVVIDISRATPEQERVIRWESDPKNGPSEFDNSEAAQKFVDEIMNLNSAKEVKNYYDNIRGWATVDYLDTYKAVNAFVGNKPIPEGKLFEEEEIDVLGNEFLQDIQGEMKRMYSMDVDMDDIKDWVQMYYIGYNSEYDEGPGDVDYEGNEFGSEDFESEKKELVFDTGEREDFYTYLEDDLDEGKGLKEEVDVNKILSDGGYDIIDDEELLMTVKSRLKGDSNIDAKKLNLLVMKIEDEEGGNIDFSEGKLNENLQIDDQAIEALYEDSEGDCRRVINLLQATAAVTNNITSDLVTSSCKVSQVDNSVFISYVLTS